MSVTFNTPVRVFKRNNPTNDGTIAPDNTGAAVVSQQVALIAGTAVTVTIPAGAIINHVTTYMSTGAAGTPNVTINGNVVGTLSTAAGVNAMVATANIPLLINVGTVDATLSYTATAATAGTLSVTYTARNPDGTITAQGAGLTNE
jgi:hypothetical protein